MGGLETTAVRISTIVSMPLASMERLASMASEALVVDAHLERLDYCAIWTMRVHQIRVTPMPYVRRVRSMALSHAPVHKDTKDRIAQKTSTNVSKVKFEF